MNPRVSLIIPALNEEESIGSTVGLIKQKNPQADFEIVVVDNGSTDKTSLVASKAGARVILEPKRGYGFALRRGFEAARGDILVMGDADLTYPLEDFRSFIAPIQEGRADFVIGNRYTPANRSSFNFLNAFGGKSLTAFGNILFLSSIRDWHCGMRAFSKKVVTSLSLETGGMEIASEMVIAALVRKLRIAQTDISYRKRTGFSKLNIVGDGFRHLFLICRRRVGLRAASRHDL